MRSILHRLDKEDGAISIMAAVLVVALITATALAVDVGRVAYTSRDQQGFTDRLVMDGLLVLEQADESATPEELYAAVQAAAVNTESVNIEGSAVGTSSDRTITNIQLGYIEGDDFRLVYDKDGAGPYYGIERPTALKIFTDSFVDFLFAIMDDEGGRTVAKDALGSTRFKDECPGPDMSSLLECDPFANALISVRSRVVGFTAQDPAVEFATNTPLFKAYLAATLDVPPASLTLVGYDGLATSYVDLGVLTGGGTVGTVDEFLNTSFTVPNVLTAMASGLRNDDAAVQASAVAALNELATASNARLDPALTFRVGDFLSVTTEDLDALLSAEMDAHTLLAAVTMAAALANGNNAVNISLTGTDVLGMTGLGGFSMNLTLVEPPKFEFGRVDYNADVPEWITRAETAQVDMDLTVDVNGYYADDLLGPLDDLVPGLLCATGPLLCPRQNVTIEVSAAAATLSLTRITCDDPESETDVDTVLTSDALLASIGSNDATIMNSRNGTVNYGINGELLSFSQVPGVQGGSDVSISGMAILDGLIEPVLGFVGADLGQAEGQVHEVDCAIRQLITLPTAG
jgi:uncharacterized membrane protein